MEMVMRALHSFVHRSSWGSSVKHVGLLIITLLLTGCAIGHTKVDLSTIEAPPPEKARIFVIRPEYHFGALVDLKVAANNNEIATLYN
jgi:hypothetical protein